MTESSRPFGLPPPVKIDPILEALKLRKEAALRRVEASKLDLRKVRLEERISRIELRKAKCAEEAARLNERSIFYHAQANHHSSSLSGKEAGLEGIQQEIRRNREKAARLKGRSKVMVQKMQKLDDEIKSLLERLDDLKERRNDLIQESQELEVQAVKVEKKF